MMNKIKMVSDNLMVIKQKSFLNLNSDSSKLYFNLFAIPKAKEKVKKLKL